MNNSEYPDKKSVEYCEQKDWQQPQFNKS